MSLVSRRSFFRLFSQNALEQIELLSSRGTEPAQPLTWISVGRLSEMTPGRSVRVPIEQEQLTLSADARGIWIVDARGERLALRLGLGGEIFVNRSEKWPAHRALSQVTGEWIDGSKETSNE